LQQAENTKEILQHAIENPRVGGSIPSLATTFK